MKHASKRLRNSASIGIVTSIVLAAFLAVGPMTAIAPPLQGTLTVTFYDLAPDTNTFPGDMNVTMIWLEMAASGGAVQVNSIDFDIAGSGITASEIASVAIWDDYDPDWYFNPQRGDPNEAQDFFECELAQNPVGNLAFTLPAFGTLDECVTTGSYTVDDLDTRYIMVYLTVDSTADPTDMIELSVTGINANGPVVGGTGTTRTIEVLTIFFEDDMESGQGGWTREGWDKGHMHEPEGLWHLSQGEEDCANNPDLKPFYHSYNTAWWYGRRLADPFVPGSYNCFYYTHMPGQYAVPTRNLGNLTTPDIDATTGSSLVATFWHLIASEPDNPVPADIGHLWLYDGAWHRLTANPYDSSSGNWWKVVVNLSAYAGMHVKLEYRFDTLDEINNANYWGWFIDDFAITGKAEAHDISVSGSNAPSVVSPSGGSLPVTSTFANIGLSDETNINIRLTVNGSTVDTGTIASLTSGSNVPRTLTWNPTVAGYDWWVCMEADPVPNENILWNNKDCKEVDVIDIPVHYIYVVRSDGTALQLVKDAWDYLNTNWAMFGTDRVVIDYTSLDLNPLTYADISGLSPAADVLVITSSAGWMDGAVPPGSEYSDAETAAITKYTLEGGHGLVLVGSVFDEMIPNNNDLAPLVGIADQGYMKHFTTTLSIDPSCTGHPLFTNVNDPFTVPVGRATAPTDESWGSGDLTTGQYCARSSNQTAAIVVNRGAYLMSFGAARGPNNDMYQLLYNAMTTSEYQVFEHDVKAENIIAPNYARVGYPVNVSATIMNIGKNNENVDVKLIVNSVQQDITNINLNSGGDFQRVTLSYTPAAEADDDVCMRADIVGFIDEDLTNNEVCTVVQSRVNPPIQVFVLDSWGTDNPALAPWLHLNANWNLYGGTPVYIDYTTFNKENIQYQELVDMNADVLVISSSYTGQGESPGAAGLVFSVAEMNAIVQYVQDGHGIIITGGTFDSEYLSAHLSGLGSLMGISDTEIYMTTYQVYDMVVQNPAQNHPLFNNIPTSYNTANGTSLSPGFSISGPEPWEPLHLSGAEYKALEDSVTPYGAVIAHEPGTYNAVYITNWVERSGNTNDRQLLYNAMLWGRSSVKAPSDFWIELFNSDADLRLTWTENPSPGLQGYNIYRADTVDGFDFGIIHDTVTVGTTQYVDPGTGIGNSNNYYYIVRAFDANGNEEQNRNIVGKFIIMVYPKTNEISIPFELQFTNTDTVFSQLEPNYNSVEAYDPMTGTWMTWDGSAGDLTDVDHMMGLRLIMKPSAGTTEFVTVGRVPGMTDITMYHDAASNFWNFVGFPRHLTTSLPQALDDYGMLGGYDLVYWYDPLDKKAHWKWFDPADPGGSPLTELRPGMGIWVHTTVAGVWSLPGS